MKHTLFTKITAVFSALLLLPFSLLLASCVKDAPGDTGDPEDTGAPAAMLEIASEGKSEYKIIRSDKDSATAEIAAAGKLFKAFKSAGIELAGIETDWEGPATKPVVPGEYEIIVGNTTRNGKVYDFDPASNGENSYTIKVIESRIIITGTNDHAITAAVDRFISEFLEGKAENGSIKISQELLIVGTVVPPTVLKIMTQNLLAGDDEYVTNMKDSSYAARCTIKLEDHTLVKREPRVLSLIETYAPDSLGVQECSSPWRTYFASKLRTIGYAIISADKNPKIGIIYNKSRVKPVAQGSFWLTEDPEKLKISTEWASASSSLIERLAQYVVFEVIETGERYIHFNTHVETNKNNVIQTKQTEVILSYIEKVSAEYGGLPVVLTGDFNYTLESTAYKTLCSGVLGDTKTLAAVSSGAGSFNKFIGKDYAKLPIDQIITTKDLVNVKTYKVIYDTFDGCFVSDHYAVISEIELK